MTAREGWKLSAYTFWADDRTLVGGDPFRSLRLTRRGAAFVHDVLEQGHRAGSDPEHQLLDRLCRANLLTQPTKAPVGTGEVTLVVPARATAPAVQRVLDAAPGIAAIVIDDGSPAPLRDRLTHDALLRVVRHESSRGPAAARNAGARLATSTWIAFADADIIAQPGWIERLLAYASGCAAVAPRVITADGGGISGRFERAACALDMGSHSGFVSPAGALSYVPSAALLVSREAFLAGAGFDETMPVGEDVDAVWRLAHQGVYYEPSVTVEHLARPSLRESLARRRQYGESSAALAERHPQLMHHGSFPFVAALPWILAMAGRPLLAVGAAASHLTLAPRSMATLPQSAARRAALTGQRRSAEALTRLMVRPLLPVTLLLALANKGFRRRALIVSAAALVTSRHTPEAAAWQLVDDAAYSTGVWRVAISSRMPRLLLPRLRFGGRRG